MELKKKFVLLFCSLTLILSMIGCSGGSYSTVKSIENSTDNSMNMSYSRFNGYKFKSLNLKSGDTLELNVTVNTSSGTLSVNVLAEDGSEIYKVDNPNTYLTEKINISKAGTYKIKLIADNHSGDYNINWKVINANS